MFFNMVWESLPETPDGWEKRDGLDVLINRIYNEQATMFEQYDQIETHISDVNFELFMK
jgi:hypothetical protein